MAYFGTIKTNAIKMRNPVINADAATLTVKSKEHGDGRVIKLNRAAGVTATLPKASGSGDKYTFVVGTTVTSNSDIIQAGNTTDEFAGNVSMIDTDDDSMVNYPALAADNFDTVTMDGTTTGGIAGSVVTVTDIASGLWLIEGLLIASGIVATPLSAA